MTEILFYPNTLSLKIGDSKKLEAIAVDQYGAQMPATVNWAVDNGGNLSDLGLFTAITEGNFTVTASVGGVSNQLIVNISSDIQSGVETPKLEDPILTVQNKNIQVMWKNHTNFTISLFNLLGQLQLNDVVMSNLYTAKMKLNSGIYIIQLNDNNRKVVRKILVN